MAQVSTHSVVVIGAGVLGCAVARELSHLDTDVLVLERAHDVGEGSSKANSGVVHAGFHPRGGSLKGTSCVEGNALFDKLTTELDIPFRRIGALMVAFERSGIDKLEEKRARAALNGAGTLPIVSGDEARALEPRLSPGVISAMLAPSTGIVSPFELVLALAQNAQANGVSFRFGANVVSISRLPADDPEGPRWSLSLDDGTTVQTRFVVNAAGDQAELLDSFVHPQDYVVRPRAGDFVVFDKQVPKTAIRHVIYQAGEHDEGGVLLAPTVSGNLLAGPTSRNVRSFSDTGASPEGFAHVLSVARHLIPSLDTRRVITGFAGVRTNITNVSKEIKDFIVRTSAPGFVSALGIKNPGLTASPALAKRAVALLREEGLVARERTGWLPQRTRYVPFLSRSEEEQARLAREDPSFDHVICRCELVTEGDVRAVMRGPLPPSTIAGMRRRLRCGMGRCQGGFCLPRVLAIMADELGVPAEQVPWGEGGASLSSRKVKR